VFSDRRDALRLLKLKEVYVGIMVIGTNFGEEAQSQLMDFMVQAPATEGIAIVDPAVVNAVDHADFLREFFFDFHTAPIEVGRLAFSLGPCPRRGAAVGSQPSGVSYRGPSQIRPGGVQQGHGPGVRGHGENQPQR